MDKENTINKQKVEEIEALLKQKDKRLDNIETLLTESCETYRATIRGLE